MFYAPSGTSSFDLQATLAVSSAMAEAPPSPHHPITCTSGLRFYDDNSLACEHAQAPPGDRRTQACIDHSIAMLLIEVLRQREAADAG
jgi:hypothetical protein